MSEGPNCFFTTNYNQQKSEYVDKIINKLIGKGATINIENLYDSLKTELDRFKLKHKASLNEVFKFSPKIMMNLLLNFESYDQTTKARDIYMPEEKIINFNVGYIKLNFKGKLRLTQDREKTIKSAKGIDQIPTATYGVIEDRDLYIKFDKPVIIKYFYIRPHFSTHENKYKNYEMTAIGYKNERESFVQRMYMIPNNREWVTKFLKLV